MPCLAPGISASPEYWVQLSPSVPRMPGRTCREKKTKTLSRCLIYSVLAKIRCKPSLRLGVRTSCGFSCVSQRGGHPLSPSCRDHTSAQWLSRVLQLPRPFECQPKGAGGKPAKALPSSCSAQHRCFPAAREHHCSLACHAPPNHTLPFPYPPRALGYLVFADLLRYPCLSLTKIFGGDSLGACGSDGAH